MQMFISALVTNGQILSMWQNTVKFINYYAYRVIAPEKNSLDKDFWNIYCEKFYNEVVALSKKEPELIFIGENYDVADCCTCASSSHFIIFTEYSDYSMPVICGDCMRGYPLYKLPKTYDRTEYFDLLSWQIAYQACDTQFMEGIGERHGYKMMHDPKSSLSKMGMKIRDFLEIKTGKNFYYFLFCYYSKNKQTCPICGEKWMNKNKKIQYDYVCEKCHVVSNDIG